MSCPFSLLFTYLYFNAVLGFRICMDCFNIECDFQLGPCQYNQMKVPVDGEPAEYYPVQNSQICCS